MLIACSPPPPDRILGWARSPAGQWKLHRVGLQEERKGRATAARRPCPRPHPRTGAPHAAHRPSFSPADASGGCSRRRSASPPPPPARRGLDRSPTHSTAAQQGRGHDGGDGGRDGDGENDGLGGGDGDRHAPSPHAMLSVPASSVIGSEPLAAARCGSIVSRCLPLRQSSVRGKCDGCA